MRPLLEAERDWLMARIEQKQDLTMHELLAELRAVACCDRPWRFLGRCGKTFEKRRSSHTNRTGPTSSAAAIAYKAGTNEMATGYT